MKNKGFTLVEVLAVIVILAILLGIAMPNIVGIGKSSKTKMYCTKVQNIENAAQQYGESIYDDLPVSSEISVSTLVSDNYYKKENETCSGNCVTDPRDGSSIDNVKIKLEKINRRITATYQGDKSPCTN